MVNDDNNKVLKIDVLSDKIIKLEAECEKRDAEVEELKIQVARLSERMTLFQAAQGAFTVLASAVAAGLAILFGGKT